MRHQSVWSLPSHNPSIRATAATARRTLAASMVTIYVANHTGLWYRPSERR
jgi:hypothetical protein